MLMAPVERQKISLPALLSIHVTKTDPFLVICSCFIRSFSVGLSATGSMGTKNRLWGEQFVRKAVGRGFAISKRMSKSN